MLSETLPVAGRGDPQACETLGLSHFLGSRLSYGQVRLSKAFAVTGCGDSQDCETLRLPNFLDNRLTDGVEVK
jgi:hypothetical protein